MSGLLTDFGDGYGYGGGYGYGDGGYGDCYGGGYGYGYGDGCGDGGGYGDGFGYGCGDYGDPVNLGVISSYSVILMRPFDIIKIGCQIMSLNKWEKEWEKVCREYEVMVSKHQIDDLIKKAICFTE